MTFKNSFIPVCFDELQVWLEVTRRTIFFERIHFTHYASLIRVSIRYLEIFFKLILFSIKNKKTFTYFFFRLAHQPEENTEKNFDRNLEKLAGG